MCFPGSKTHDLSPAPNTCHATENKHDRSTHTHTHAHLALDPVAEQGTDWPAREASRARRRGSLLGASSGLRARDARRGKNVLCRRCIGIREYVRSVCAMPLSGGISGSVCSCKPTRPALHGSHSNTAPAAAAAAAAAAADPTLVTSHHGATKGVKGQ
eukprot:1151197-Pelagomonas_calceolata.AAC.3